MRAFWPYLLATVPLHVFWGSCPPGFRASPNQGARTWGTGNVSLLPVTKSQCQGARIEKKRELGERSAHCCPTRASRGLDLGKLQGWPGAAAPGTATVATSPQDLGAPVDAARTESLTSGPHPQWLPWPV